MMKSMSCRQTQIQAQHGQTDGDVSKPHLMAAPRDVGQQNESVVANNHGRLKNDTSPSFSISVRLLTKLE